MAYVIGPNGVRTYVPDNVARSLVGNGERGYRYADPVSPEPRVDQGPDSPKPKAAPKRRTRRSAKSSTADDS